MYARASEGFRFYDYDFVDKTLRRCTFMAEHKLARTRAHRGDPGYPMAALQTTAATTLPKMTATRAYE